MGLILVGGTTASKQEVGAAASLPAHVVAKPLHGDHYRVSRRFVPAGTTTTGILWAFRNPTASGKVMVLKRARLRGLNIAAPTAAIEDRFSLRIARGYTVVDPTNAASISPAAAMQKMRTSMANAAAQVRESNAAAGISGGTRTLDTDGIATGSLWVPAAVAAAPAAPLDIFDYLPSQSDEHPDAMVADEGWVLQNENAFGATSGIVLFLDLYWAEVNAF